MRAVLFRAYFGMLSGLMAGAVLYGLGAPALVQVAGELFVVAVCFWRGARWFA